MFFEREEVVHLQLLGAEDFCVKIFLYLIKEKRKRFVDVMEEREFLQGDELIGLIFFLKGFYYVRFEFG